MSRRTTFGDLVFNNPGRGVTTRTSRGERAEELITRKTLISCMHAKRKGRDGFRWLKVALWGNQHNSLVSAPPFRTRNQGRLFCRTRDIQRTGVRCSKKSNADSPCNPSGQCAIFLLALERFKAVNDICLCRVLEKGSDHSPVAEARSYFQFVPCSEMSFLFTNRQICQSYKTSTSTNRQS